MAKNVIETRNLTIYYLAIVATGNALTLNLISQTTEVDVTPVQLYQEWLWLHQYQPSADILSSFLYTFIVNGDRS